MEAWGVEGPGVNEAPVERQSRPRPSREVRIDSPMLRYNITRQRGIFCTQSQRLVRSILVQKPPDGADGGEEVSQMNEFSIKYQGRRYEFLTWNAMKESIADCGLSTYEHSRPGDGCHRSPRPGLLIDREVNQDHARFQSSQKFSFPFSARRHRRLGHSGSPAAHRRFPAASGFSTEAWSQLWRTMQKPQPRMTGPGLRRIAVCMLLPAWA